MPAQNFQQLFVTALAYRSTQLAYLCNRLWQDFQLNGVLRGMFYERVTGLKLELAGIRAGRRDATRPLKSGLFPAIQPGHREQNPPS